METSELKRRLRRDRDTLAIVGLGVMAFGVWSVIRAAALFLLHVPELRKDARGAGKGGAARMGTGQRIAGILSGVIDILHGREAKSFGGSWKLTVAHGVVNILVALACVAFLNSVDILVCLYCAGLFYSALVRIAAALRKSAIVYIQ